MCLWLKVIPWLRRIHAIHSTFINRYGLYHWREAGAELCDELKIIDIALLGILVGRCGSFGIGPQLRLLGLMVEGRHVELGLVIVARDGRNVWLRQRRLMKQDVVDV